MDDLKRARTELRRAAYEDRAIKNLKDGYNFDESRKFSEVLLNGLNGSGEWEKIFRTRINLLLMHAMMLCGETSSQTCVACILTTRDPTVSR
jgi:hypothetical protein